MTENEKVYRQYADPEPVEVLSLEYPYAEEEAVRRALEADGWRVVSWQWTGERTRVRAERVTPAPREEAPRE
jgi:hypothetical protein